MIKRFIFILIAALQMSVATAEDTVTMFGAIKTMEANQIKIQLLSKEILSGPRNMILNLDLNNTKFQYFEIKKNNLKEFNLIKQ